jgi:hypothetical protein
MDERTRAATYQDVLRIVELLDAEHVEYALIGGYALALQGIVRLTEDVDILVEPTLENSKRWVRALSQLPDGAAKELGGDETPPPDEAEGTAQGSGGRGSHPSCPFQRR